VGIKCSRLLSKLFLHLIFSTITENIYLWKGGGRKSDNG